MPKMKNTKIKGIVELDEVPLTQLTKIEIAPIMNQKSYAITLRFAITDDFTFPPAFKDGALSKLIVSHPNLPHPFKFNAEFIDMGFESNCSFSELTVFVRGRKIDEQKPVLTSLPEPKIVLAG